MKDLLCLIIILTLAVTTQSSSLLSAGGIIRQEQPTKTVKVSHTSTTTNSAVKVNHRGWNRLLKKYADTRGFVDCETLQQIVISC